MRSISRCLNRRNARSTSGSWSNAATSLVIADALARHAPEVPVNVIDSMDHGAMQQAVKWAATQAQPGDVVLLAPGCASKDMYTDYAARGDAFAAAAKALTG